MRTVLVSGLTLIIAASAAQAQFSGYASGSYGFSANPLYNYETVADHVAEGYWEMNYALSSKEHDVRAGYVGGLMIFNGLTERNYYEHRLTLAYAARFGKFRRPAPADTGEGDAADVPEQFRGDVFDLGASLSSRYDTQLYNEFDNQGADATVGFTWGYGAGTDFRISNQGGIRRYQYLPELNNVTDLVKLRISSDVADSIRLGWFVQGGVKHFTTGEVDTTRVIVGGGPSFTPGNRGKGKGGGNLGSNGSSQSAKVKALLENFGTNNTYQLGAGVDLRRGWSDGSFNAQLIYRYNPGTNVRFLVQYANSSILSQDIYNDYFSYGGPDLTLGLRQKLPLGLQIQVQAEAAWRKYLVPALDLEGVETGSNRVDTRGMLEVMITRSFPIDDFWTVDLFVDGIAVRNQSNDAYNDYAVRAFSLGIGIGL